jgi:hypothetical protein
MLAILFLHIVTAGNCSASSLVDILEELSVVQSSVVVITETLKQVTPISELVVIDKGWSGFLSTFWYLKTMNKIHTELLVMNAGGTGFPIGWHKSVPAPGRSLAGDNCDVIAWGKSQS